MFLSCFFLVLAENGAVLLESEEIFSPDNLSCLEGTTADFVFSRRHKIKSCTSDAGLPKEERMDQVPSYQSSLTLSLNPLSLGKKVLADLSLHVLKPVFSLQPFLTHPPGVIPDSPTGLFIDVHVPLPGM